MRWLVQARSLEAGNPDVLHAVRRETLIVKLLQKTIPTLHLARHSIVEDLGGFWEYLLEYYWRSYWIVGSQHVDSLHFPSCRLSSPATRSGGRRSCSCAARRAPRPARATSRLSRSWSATMVSVIFISGKPIFRTTTMHFSSSKKRIFQCLTQIPGEASMWKMT